MSTAVNFYDALSSDYDVMTGFEQRLVAERPFFRLIVERYAIGRALDAGCGTGFHSVLLAQQGVDVTAVDVSGAMLAKVCAHAQEYGVHVRTVRAEFSELTYAVDPGYDAVFSLGNALAHLVTTDALHAALTNFATVLAPGGVVILQLVNFDRILSTRQRIQSVKEREGSIFVRFYDFEPECVRFNVLILKRTAGVITHRLDSIALHPIRSSVLIDAVLRCGFVDPMVYGGISLEPFDQQTSNDIVVIARKGLAASHQNEHC